MGEAARRRKADPNYGKPRLGEALPQFTKVPEGYDANGWIEAPDLQVVTAGANQRGLVVSGPFTTEHKQLTLRPQLDAQELRFSLLFWDRLVWPLLATGLVPFTYGPDEQFLEQAALLCMPRVSFHGEGEVGTVMALMHHEVFARLDTLQPGIWSLATGEKSFVWHEQPPSTANAALVELVRAIPVPDKEVPLAELLEFKVQRRDQILRLRSELDMFMTAIANADDKAAELTARTRMVEEACAELLRVGKEWRFPVRLADLKCSVEVNPGQVLTAIFGSGAAGISLGMPTVGALLAGISGAASILKITGDIKRQQMRPRATPYEYVYSFHTEVF